MLLSYWWGKEDGAATQGIHLALPLLSYFCVFLFMHMYNRKGLEVPITFPARTYRLIQASPRFYPSVVSFTQPAGLYSSGEPRYTMRASVPVEHYTTENPGFSKRANKLVATPTVTYMQLLLIYNLKSL
jgi:hypothetical protein